MTSMNKRCREHVCEDVHILKRCRMSDTEKKHSMVDERVYTHSQVLIIIEEVESRYRDIINQCLTRFKQPPSSGNHDHRLEYTS